MSGIFVKGDRVVYIPQHAEGDRNHKDCEAGVVSGVNDLVTFVKFDRAVGLYGDQAIGQSCYAADLVHE